MATIAELLAAQQGRGGFGSVTPQQVRGPGTIGGLSVSAPNPSGGMGDPQLAAKLFSKGMSDEFGRQFTGEENALDRTQQDEQNRLARAATAANLQTGIGARQDAASTLFDRQQQMSQTDFDRGADERRARLGLLGAQAESERAQAAKRRMEARNDGQLGGFKDLKSKITSEKGFRNDFNALTKENREGQVHFNKIQTSFQDPSPAGDMSGVFAFMKMLDPISTVRESEFENVAKAKPALEKAGISWDEVKRIWKGDTLTPGQRADFMKRSNMLNKTNVQDFNRKRQQYSNIATRSGLDPSLVTPGLSRPQSKLGDPTIKGIQKLPTGGTIEYLD